MSAKNKLPPSKAPLDNSIATALKTYKDARQSSTTGMRKTQIQVLLRLHKMIMIFTQLRKRSSNQWASTLFHLMSKKENKTKQLYFVQPYAVEGQILIAILKKTLVKHYSFAFNSIKVKAKKCKPLNVIHELDIQQMTFEANGHSIESTELADEPNNNIVVIARILDRVVQRSRKRAIMQLRNNILNQDDLDSKSSSKEKIAIKFAATNMIANRLNLKAMNIYSQLMVTIQLIAQSRLFFEKSEQMLNDQILNQKIQQKLQSMSTMCYLCENVYRGYFYSIGESSGFLTHMKTQPSGLERGMEILDRIEKQKLSDAFNDINTLVWTGSVRNSFKDDNVLFGLDGFDSYFPKVQQPALVDNQPSNKSKDGGNNQKDSNATTSDQRFRDYSFQKNTLTVTEIGLSTSEIELPKQRVDSVKASQMEDLLIVKQLTRSDSGKDDSSDEKDEEVVAIGSISEFKNLFDMHVVAIGVIMIGFLYVFLVQ